MTTSIQRAIELQTKLEAEASAGPWGVKTCTCECCAYFTPKDIMYTSNNLAVMPPGNAALIAHLRNQAKLARDTLELADIHIREGGMVNAQRLAHALQAWADHVNGEGKP